MKTNTKKLIGAALIGGLALGGLGGHFIMPNTVDVINPVNTQLAKDNGALAEQIEGLNAALAEKPTEVEIPVEVEVENPINTQTQELLQESNQALDAAMDMLEDEVDEDIDVDYILFEVDAKMTAEKWIEDNLVELLDDEDYFDDGEALEDYRKSEVSVKTIYDADIMDRDFDDKDLELSYEVKIKAKESGQDPEYLYFDITIPFENGNMEEDDIEIELM